MSRIRIIRIYSQIRIIFSEAMRRAYKNHKISPDAVYNDVAVAQLINKVMKKGKKTTAQKIVYQAFDAIKQKTQKEPLEIFKKN